ncbi:histamine H1 receptor [Nannospalax galili]|uniref:Histamine H1 receptor n=1 Tax=Nannospalax galili TaxID=1026970 RepID=A0A8C6RTE1_NANGA|nr:histamine H1 receptor [Nannospalax galili]XP_017650312.1 histamine H1 receptor [Nannospalax galili]XP_029412946.1 histamine H1 receptor [Nannospalax galili]XP_029412947.1 histamine H1 receptor [Nannospalax galili]XP_029412948.1 histamine H1 receptor [Nannospalax galili]XP_029412949.1 histamine H1 receptor [Nannospalax galili]XP_029412950.1 histamine H1 receptor [Nannospalax galili]XP_029412951.1 histamine H1 receptor [Nannospalax galili]XP_029412952.1 histamine H1 receptor [Nannospalax g
MSLPNSSSVLEDKMCEGNRTTMANTQLLPLVVVLSTISLVTVGLNLLVLYAVRSERKLHTVGNLYIVSLSVADLIVGAVVMPMNILYLLMAKWSLGRPLCLFWLSMDYVASTASIFSVFILCIDRYRSVQQPLRYLRYRTKTRASATILGAWFLSFLWVIPILGWHHFISKAPEPPKDKCETDFYNVTWFKIMTAIINFYLPTLLMLWFYIKIYKAVRRHCQHRQLTNGSLPSFLEIKLRSENVKDVKKSGKESPWGGLKRPSRDTGGGSDLKSPSEDPKEIHSPTIFSQEESGDTATFHCFQLDIRQTQTVTEGGSRGSEANDQVLSQVKTDERRLNTCRINETSEDQILVDRQSFSRTTDSDTSTEPGLGRGKLRSGSNSGLDYIKITWKRLRSHSRQYVSGLHLNRERKAAKQLGFIMAAFILCWIPYFIFFMVIAFCKSCCSEPVHMFTIWLGYINSTLNPLIYPLCNENFKKTFKKILHIRS